tara:strand:- start:1632 stop:1862 length:231 start_codon:yes stop_codon:yes gene_type:complete
MKKDIEFYKKQEASLLKRIDTLKQEIDKLLLEKIETKQLNLPDVSSILVANGMPAFGTKEFNDMCSNFFGGKPKSN